MEPLKSSAMRRRTGRSPAASKRTPNTKLSRPTTAKTSDRQDFKKITSKYNKPITSNRFPTEIYLNSVNSSFIFSNYRFIKYLYKKYVIISNTLNKSRAIFVKDPYTISCRKHGNKSVVLRTNDGWKLKKEQEAKIYNIESFGAECTRDKKDRDSSIKYLSLIHI